MATYQVEGKQRKIAIVVQRYGEAVNGGAEQHARWLAERLCTLGDVTVLTTCALDYHTWANHFPAGESVVNGVRVRRFPVDRPRHWKKAQKSTRHLLLNEHSLLDEVAWIQEQGPLSSPLLQAISDGYAQYDAFIFFTYLYATTYFGLPLVSDKAILVPTAHDDPFLDFALFRPLFHLPRAIAYNTAAEQKMVNAVMHNQDVQQITAGIGINTPAAVDGARFRQKYGVEGDFLLYVGRIDHSKNVAELLDFFIAFRAQWKRPLTLLLGGKAHLPIPDHPDIRALGFISEQDKFDGMSAAAVLMMPSLFESLSMVTLEAWLMGTPTLINSNCMLMKEQVRLSNAGLYYSNQTEFTATLQTLLEQPALREKLGQSGKAFVEKTYSWEVILEKYERLFDGAVQRPRIVLIMGVSGCGKSTIGQGVAARLGWAYYEADDFHPAANVDKMAAGTPLNDADRAPWLAAIHAEMSAVIARGETAVFTCSALKQAYRTRLIGDLPVTLVYLKGSYQLIAERMAARPGHFMKAEMLRSQFETLEEPTAALTVTIDLPINTIIAQIAHFL